MEIYIQLGAGTGDKDIRTNFRDGFTEFVKNKKLNHDDKIILVEANPFNIPKLSECWKKYKNKNIFNFAIVDEMFIGKEAYIHFAEDDKPCYQVSSLIYNHVKKHYPKSKILKKKIKVKKINEFLYENCINSKINYLAIDIEGLDHNVIMNIDFDQFFIQNLSFETLHLSLVEKFTLINKLTSKGYKYIGKGFDIDGWDLMFAKKKSMLAFLRTEILKCRFILKECKNFFKKNIKKFNKKYV